MALVDYFKKKPDYVIDGVDFHGGASAADRGKKSFGNSVEPGSLYVFPRLHMHVERMADFHWYVRIIGPKAKWIQGKGLHEGYAAEYSGRIPKDGDIFLECPGIAGNNAFTDCGSWHFFLIDEQDNILISKSFYIEDPDAELMARGYMSISSVLFSDSDAGPWLKPDQTSFDSNLKYLYCRMEYRSVGLWEGSKDITLDVEVVKNGNTRSGFSKDVTVKSGGGFIYLGGWGTKTATWYTPGNYEYRILFKENLLYSAKFSVKKSLKDDGYIVLGASRFSTREEPYLEMWMNTDDVNSAVCTRIRSRDIEGKLWFGIKYYNYSPNQSAIYCKLVTPYGQLFTSDRFPGCPDGYSCYKTVGAGEAGYFCFSFSCLMEGRFMLGNYRLSLWTKNYTGAHVCLAVRNVEVE